jgi:hypothetical protein
MAVMCSCTHPTDLALSACHVFRVLEDHMRGQHCEHDTVQEDAGSWLQGAAMDFCFSRILKLMQNWQKHMDCSGGSVEK